MDSLVTKIDDSIDEMKLLVNSLKDDYIPDRITQGLEIFEEKLRLIQASFKLDSKRKLDPISKTQTFLVNTVKVIQENQKLLKSGSKDLQLEMKKIQKTNQLEAAVMEKMHSKLEVSLKANIGKVEAIPDLIQRKIKESSKALLDSMPPSCDEPDSARLMRNQFKMSGFEM